MVSITVTNVTLKSRGNQNTTFIFSDREWGFTKESRPSEDWLLENLEEISPRLKKQKDTKIKINWQS